MIRITKFVAVPSYREKKVSILWGLSVTENVTTLRVHILRSTKTGAGDWKAITPSAGLGRNIDFFDDSLPTNANELAPGELVYKIVVVYKRPEDAAASRYNGPTIGVFGIITRREFSICQSLIRNEVRQMYLNRRGLLAGGGRVVVVFAPDVDGPPDASFDASAGQQHGDSKYGGPKGFVGGWVTWMRQIKTTRDIVEIEEIKADIQDNQSTARMLALPIPKIDYVVVDPHTDQRWVINKSDIDYGARGFIPIAATVELTLLPITDKRYHIPVTIPDHPVFSI